MSERTERIYLPGEYPTGAVKQDPDTLAVAVRSTHGDDHHAWGVMTVGHGGHYATAAEVQSWPDLAPAADP